jgi:hypothetical protein
LHTTGELFFTSGHIVVCAPLVFPDALPLADSVSLGRYPVILSVAESSGGDRQVACALLLLSEHPAAQWEMAVPQGRSLESLEPGYISGYPVDAGTGCFMEAVARRAPAAPSTPATEETGVRG